MHASFELILAKNEMADNRTGQDSDSDQPDNIEITQMMKNDHIQTMKSLR